MEDELMETSADTPIFSKMDNFLCSLDDDWFDALYDSSLDCSDDLGSPCSNDSDQENQHTHQCHAPRRNQGHTGKKIQARTAANIRERRRMKSINDAFEHLRKCIPTNESPDRKLSKVDTLKFAMKYITYLSDVIQSTNSYSQNSQSPDTEVHEEKVILRCQFTDSEANNADMAPLLGHSLSWSDGKKSRKTSDNKMAAKLWIPDLATDNDLINLSNYSNSYSADLYACNLFS